MAFNKNTWVLMILRLQVLLGGQVFALFAQDNSGYGLFRPDPCNRHEVNGCSVPFKNILDIVKSFTPACNRHDVCYGCGMDYNFTRKECDQAFLVDMTEICKTSSGLRRKRASEWNLQETNDMLRESSVQSFLSNQQLFTAAAEDIIGKNLDDFFAHATDVQVEQAMRDVIPLWSAMLRTLRGSKVSDQRAWDLFEGFRQSERMRRNADQDDDELSRCLFAARTGYALVRSAGFLFYRNPSLSYCHEDFVAGCLPQN